MKFTKETIKGNEKTILKIMGCQCGETLMIGAPVMKPKANKDGLELDYFTAICPECETQWKVKINFEET